MDTKKITFLSAKFLLGLPLILFGTNKFGGFIDIAPPEDPLAQAFLGTMFTTYLYKFVAITEIAGGILLLTPRTAFLGCLILIPVVANVSIFHLAHDMPGNGIWLLPTLTLAVVISNFKDEFKTLLV